MTIFFRVWKNSYSATCSKFQIVRYTRNPSIEERLLSYISWISDWKLHKKSNACGSQTYREKSSHCLKRKQNDLCIQILITTDISDKAIDTYPPIIFCMRLAKEKTMTKYNCSGYCYLRSASKTIQHKSKHSLLYHGHKIDKNRDKNDW